MLWSELDTHSTRSLSPPKRSCDNAKAPLLGADYDRGLGRAIFDIKSIPLADSQIIPLRYGAMRNVDNIVRPLNERDLINFEYSTVETDDNKPRLSLARRYFGFINPEDIEFLMVLYSRWVNYDEYGVCWAKNIITDEDQYWGVKCSKRGNDVYSKRLDSKLGFLKTDESCFDPLKYDDLPSDASSNILWVTLTYDAKRCSLDAAWRNISHDFNLWITNIRNKYGHVSCCAFPQAFPGSGGSAYGYPHLHVVMMFDDVKFHVFKRLETNRDGNLDIVYRIKEKDELHEQGKWHSFIDVKAISSMGAVWSYAKKHCYNAAFGSSDAATLNNTIMWFYRKKSFNISRDFRSRYTEFIRTMHSSKPDYQQTLDGQRLNEWKITWLGVFDLRELKLDGDKPPPWYVALDKNLVHELVKNKGRSGN